MKELSQSDCDNCGTPLEGEYCHCCGQRKINFKKDWKGLTHEFLGGILNFEGKMLVGLANLAFRPGHLIRDYLDGKRVSQIPPVRAYLFVSLLFFFMISSEINNGMDVSLSDGERDESSDVVQDISGVPMADGVDEDMVTKMNASLSDAELSDVVQERTREVIAGEGKDDGENVDVEVIKDIYVRWMPRLFWVGVFVLALILKVLFFRYPLVYLEYLVVALNLQTFVFLWILVVSGWGNLIELLNPALSETLADWAMLWVLICPVLAFRRIFEISVLKSVLKSCLVGILYFGFLLFSLVVVGILWAWKNDFL